MGFGILTALCGVGTLASLSATPISIPWSGALATCTGGSAKFTVDAFNATLEDYSEIRGYEEYKDEIAKEIEGYFVQIPSSIHD